MTLSHGRDEIDFAQYRPRHFRWAMDGAEAERFGFFNRLVAAETLAAMRAAGVSHALCVCVRLEDLPRLLAAARRAPHRIVIGSRRASRLPAPRSRRVANRVADFWISWAAGHPIADSQCGFRVYPATLLRALPARRRRPRGFAFEAALLIEAARAGYRTIAVDVPALYGGASQRASHFRPVADVTKIVLVVAARLLARGLSPWSLWRALTLPEEHL